MKKKPLSTYPNIPLPRVDQFTLPELINELFRNKQFNAGIQNLLSNCIITNKTQSYQKAFTQTCINSNNNKYPPPQSPVSSSFSKQDASSSLIPPNSQDECEFIFQSQVRNRMMYPWLLNDQSKQEIVQCTLITDQITGVIQDAIQCSLHSILNKEFINVTNQILAMREEINVFTKEELQRTDDLKAQLKRDLEKMEKKLQQQQHISSSLLSQPLERFARSKGVLNTNSSNNSTKQSNKCLQQDEFKGSSSIHHDVFSLKKQIDTIKKSLLSSNSQSKKPVSSQSILHLEQKLATNQERMNQLELTLKLSLQEHKQKWKKNHEKLCSQLATNTSKQYLSKQVKKTVQSNLKIYLDELMKCKKEIQDFNERLQKNGKGMQEYIGNQLKNLWMLVSGVKTRVKNIEDQFNVGMDQSFVL